MNSTSKSAPGAKMALEIICDQDVVGWKNFRRSNNYRKITLRDKNISNLNLEGFSFINMDLSGCDISYSNLSNCKFDRADLSNVSFVGANLRNASFYLARMKGVNLQGAATSLADFSNAIGLNPNDMPESYGNRAAFPFRRGWQGKAYKPEEEKAPESDVLPSKVTSPISTKWENEILVAGESDLKVAISDSAIGSAIRSLCNHINELQELLRESNIDRRLIDDLAALQSIISVHPSEFGKHIFDVAFKLEQIQSFVNELSEEMSRSYSAKMSAMNYNAKSILMQFPDYAEFMRNLDRAKIQSYMFEPGSIDKAVQVLDEFHTNMFRRRDVIDSSVTKSLVNDVEMLSGLGGKPELHEQMFGLFSNIANILWNLFKPILAEAQGGAREGFREGTRRSVAFILTAGGGTVAWLLLNASGAFEWLGPAWAAVKALL